MLDDDFDEDENEEGADELGENLDDFVYWLYQNRDMFLDSISDGFEVCMCPNCVSQRNNEQDGMIFGDIKITVGKHIFNVYRQQKEYDMYFN